MNKWIVVTTIHRPSEAIRRISELITSDGWRCVVVGDKKTPADWASPGIDYLSYEEQLRLYGELARKIPANHYCRKNLGYLFAIERDAEVILETDDDNIPMPSFGKGIDPIVSGDLVARTKWSNVYKYFSDQLIWPRGNPLDTVHDAGDIVGQATYTAPIQQYLADGDPDVDAIYRLLYKAPLSFKPRKPVLLDKGTWCSFNSQNTVFFKEAFPLLYLPCHVSFRMTDIWRSFVAQAGLWTRNQRLAFKSATVVQERNAHNLIKDFSDEVDGYLNNDRIASELAILCEQSRHESLPEFVRAAWSGLRGLGLVQEVELDIYDAWAGRCRAVL